MICIHRLGDSVSSGLPTLPAGLTDPYHTRYTLPGSNHPVPCPSYFNTIHIHPSKLIFGFFSN